MLVDNIVVIPVRCASLDPVSLRCRVFSLLRIQNLLKKRVKCFIDGFNLYHAIDDLRINHLKWVDLYGLASAFIKPSQEILDSVFYFTAYATWKSGAFHRHKLYVKALETVGVTPVIGHFKEKYKRCSKCGNHWITHEEKQSDVNLAIYLLHQAHINGFDKALIISADSDLCSVIDLVLDTFPEKEITVLTPPNRYQISREIRSHITTIRIRQKHIKANLLPNIIYKPGTQRSLVKRPKQYEPC